MKSCFALRLSFSLAMCCLAGSPTRARGDIELLDLNATVRIIPSSGIEGGNYSWRVNGTEGLFHQWFWYREGEGEQTREYPIDRLAIKRIEQTASNRLEMEYGSERFSIITRHALKGKADAVPVSWLSTGVEIVNHTDEPLDMHFFHYADFDLNGSPSGEIATFLSPSFVHQTEGSALTTQTVSIPASHWELDYYSRTRDRLNDDSPTTLNDTSGPTNPGDVTWAFQWDYVIPGHDSFVLQIEQRLALPEPGSVMLLALGGPLLLRRRRR